MPPAATTSSGSGRRAVGEPGGAGDDAHHLRREAAEILRACSSEISLSLPSPQSPASRAVSACGSAGALPVRPAGSYGSGSGMTGSRSSSTRSPQTRSYGYAADELLDVDAPVPEHAAFAVGLRDLGLDRDDALEPGLEVRDLAHRAGRYLTRDSSRASATIAAAMAHRVTLIPGDGTGPELTEATRRVLEATGVAFEWDVRQAGVDVMEEAGTPLPEETLASVKANGVALKGPITTPIGTGFRSVNVALRHELELYACLRPCKSYPGVRSRYEDVDVVIVRENTEDLYAGIEYEAIPRRPRTSSTR